MKLNPTLCFLAAALTASVGCSSLKPSGNSWNPLTPFSESTDAQSNVEPVSMAVVWKDSVYEQPSVPSIKGFGGRFFIYDAKNNPIKTDGELIVYGYDESNPIHANGSHTGADKKFVFPSEKFQRHYSDSDLGPSYSVWIPWEETGGVRKSITLIPVFKTTSGNVLRCGHSMILLPGRKPEPENNNVAANVSGNANTNVGVIANASGNKNTNSENVVAQASFQQVPANQQNNRLVQVSANTDIQPHASGMRTTTFNVTPSLAKRLTKTPNLPKLPSKSGFPHPNKPVKTDDKQPDTSTPSGEIESPSVNSIHPAPRVFGMPGSF